MSILDGESPKSVIDNDPPLGFEISAPTQADRLESVMIVGGEPRDQPVEVMHGDVGDKPWYGLDVKADGLG